MKAVAAVAVIAVVLGAGFYLGTTQYGLFGIHLVEPLLPASGDPALVAQAIEDAEIIAAADTYGATRQALARLEAARDDASLNRSLIARSLLHESYYQVRYGQDAESASPADVLRVHLQRRGDEAPRIHVALAADALRNADIDTATSELALAAQDDPTDVYLDLVAGEIALKARDGQSAVDAFDRAMKKHDSARAQWGLARGYRVLGVPTRPPPRPKATQQLSPNHAGARVAVADLLIPRARSTRPTSCFKPPRALHRSRAPHCGSRRPTSLRRSPSSRASRSTGDAWALLVRCTKRRSSSTRATPTRRSGRRDSSCSKAPTQTPTPVSRPCSGPKFRPAPKST